MRQYMVVRYTKDSAHIVKENLSYDTAWAYARHKKHTTKSKDYEVETQR